MLNKDTFLGVMTHRRDAGGRTASRPLAYFLQTGRKRAVLATLISRSLNPRPVILAAEPQSCGLDLSAVSRVINVPQVVCKSGSMKHDKALLCRELSELNPTVLVVDGANPVARLGNDLEIPYVLVRHDCRAIEESQYDVYRGAQKIVAAYPELFEVAETPAWIRDKTIYFGAVSRFAGNPPVNRLDVRKRLGVGASGRVAIVFADSYYLLSDAMAAAEAFPEVTWFVVGLAKVGTVETPENLRLIRIDEWDAGHLSAADLVMAPAGYEVLLDAGLYRVPLAVLDREGMPASHRREAKLLTECNLGIALSDWPRNPLEWIDAFEGLEETDLRGWAELFPDGTESEIAQVIDEIASSREVTYGTAQDTALMQ